MLVVWGFVFLYPGVPVQAKAIPNASVPSPRPELNATPVELAVPVYANRPKIGATVGIVSFPRLKENWTIHEGTDAKQLARGVGHYRGSVLPGMVDNSVLSGHRTTVFNHLGRLRKGDLINVKTIAGVFTYRVRSFRIVAKTDRTVIVPTKSAVLTLTTCYPFNHVGVTTKAFIVTSDLVGSKLKS